MSLPERYAQTGKEILAAIEKAGAVGISSHVNPDGDSVGSLLALSMVLAERGKRVHASLPDPASFPPQYLFLPGRELLARPEDIPSGLEAFVVLDCSNPERLESVREAAQSAASLINIDHHEDNRFYGTLNLVDERASSTSELVFHLLESAGWELTPRAATCLYTGLVTDTGRFQHRNTSPDTFVVASRMLAAGADIFRMVQEVYESQSLAYTRLLGLALQRTEFLDRHGLAYSFITRADLELTGAALPETEDLIDHLRLVRGCRMVALFKELENGKVRVSLRSREGREVGPIARAMGGGGHAMAAGYTSDLDLEGSIGEFLDVLDHGG